VGIIHVCQVPGYDESVVADECVASGSYAFFAVGGKWDVSAACVTAVEGPFCFAVADYEDAWVGHCDGVVVPDAVLASRNREGNCNCAIVLRRKTRQSEEKRRETD
jgi:hypothetical protein